MKIKLESHTEICDLYKNGKTSPEIGKFFGTSGTQILNILKKYSVERNKGVLNDKEEEIRKLYIVENKDIVKVAELLCVRPSSIYNFMIKKNIPIKDSSVSRKKHKLNHEYFKIIDTEQKAYFLGLLYADGNLSSERYIISLSLQEKDKEILEKFRKELSYSNKLKSIDYSERPNTSNQNVLRIYDKRMYNDLITLGCTPKKSLTLKFPTEEQVPKELISHFIRGYFDGDGCVFITETKQGVQFCGTEDFLLSLRDIFEEKVNMNRIKILGNNHSKCFSYCMRAYNVVESIYDYMYKDANIYLKRKKNKFIELFDKHKNKL